MTLDLLRTIVDFGLLVLIWLVQLVIYPSFRYFTKDGLLIWHQRYTRQITYVVMPLMMFQVALLGLQLLQGLDVYTLASGILILALWLLTFGLFIPLHTLIASGQFKPKDLRDLVMKNWWRTGLWTMVFLLSIAQLLF